MTDNVHAWPKPAGRADEPLPPPIVRPCDWGLYSAIQSMEVQVGTIETYNRVARAAAGLKAQIDAGKAKAQNPLFAVSISGDVTLRPRPTASGLPPGALAQMTESTIEGTDHD